LISNKDRFDAIRSFTLASAEEKSRLVRNHMYTIQVSDASASLEDCNRTLEAILNLALAGLTRLRRMAEFRTDAHREIIVAYRAKFCDIRQALPAEEPLNVFQRLREVPKGREGYWDETILRGTPFGRARLITLDVLISALNSLDEIRTHRLYL